VSIPPISLSTYLRVSLLMKLLWLSPSLSVCKPLPRLKSDLVLPVLFRELELSDVSLPCLPSLLELVRFSSVMSLKLNLISPKESVVVTSFLSTFQKKTWLKESTRKLWAGDAITSSKLLEMLKPLLVFTTASALEALLS
jgi:hypothetical protein